jgi:hypothetical protein
MPLEQVVVVPLPQVPVCALLVSPSHGYPDAGRIGAFAQTFAACAVAAVDAKAKAIKIFFMISPFFTLGRPDRTE